MPVPSYSSLNTIGHKYIRDIFDGPVVVQEKVDGSQFSFQIVLDEQGNRHVECRSKGAQLHIDAPDKMFALGIAAISSLKDLLTPGLVYRGEYLQRPKHNALAYDRVPTKHVILFDVEDRRLGEGYFMSPDALKAEADRLGLECSPVIYQGVISDAAPLREMLERVSVLGGAKLEGVVVKNYAKFTDDHKVMMGKFVSEAFKEVHAGEWRKANPTREDVVTAIIARYRTPARWQKALQHLREAGKIEGTPRDIGPLIKETGEDVQRECEAEIRDELFAYFWPQIRRALTGGLPEWYKETLMEDALRADGPAEPAPPEPVQSPSLEPLS